MRWLKTLIWLTLCAVFIGLGLFEIFFWFGTPVTTLATTDKYITVAGSKITYSVSGSGPAVMVLHSGAWSSTEFAAVTSELKNHYTIYAVNLPGFGTSDKPQVTYSLAWLNTRLTSFIDEFPEKKFHLVGASIGGSLALELASQFPDRITSVTIIDPLGFGEEINRAATVVQIPIFGELVFYPNRATFDYALAHGLSDNAQLDDATKQQLYTECLQPKAQRAKLSLLRSLVTMQGLNPTVQTEVQTAAKLVQQPSLIIWGENDSYAPISQLDTAIALMPKAKVKRLATGHFAQLEAPKEVAAAIDHFIQQP